MVPLPDTAFFVHAPANVVRQRKQELSIEKIEELNGAYAGMAKADRMVVLENSGSVEEAIDELVNAVLERRRQRFALTRTDS